MAGKTLWIFGHQLSLRMPGFHEIDPQKDRILIVQADSRALWMKYHKQKIAFVYAAMRHFELELKQLGYQVDYRRSETFQAGWEAHCDAFSPDEVIVHVPTDFRFRKLVLNWADKERRAHVRLLEESALFLVAETEWNDLLPDNHSWKLDGVYRQLRKKYQVLVDKSDKPVGGKWSFDAENRKPPDPSLKFEQPEFPILDDLTQSVLEEVEQKFAQNPGELHPFAWPVTRKQAERLREHFFQYRLSTFGDFQDAMIQGDPFMSHSMLSAAINIGLLDPLETVRMAEMRYHQAGGSLASVEGFIRQVLGWREYVRGVYLRTMPAYAHSNELSHHEKLPNFYWDAQTKMNCLSTVVGEVLDHGYSHHIQRLMVLGNFANLAGVNPQEVSDWFNQMYVDAYDWVVLPNVLGMALYADGGKMSTKPYVSSGLYIDRMSDYCKNCHYRIKERVGELACPFHSLYWHFIDRHQDRWEKNPRMIQMVRNWSRMDDEIRAELLGQAELVLERMRLQQL